MPKRQSVHSSARLVIAHLHLFGVAVVLLALGILVYQERYTTVFAKATSHQAQPYTELYFSNPTHLPSAVRSGQTLPVQFTIHNLEARQVTYTYDIDFSAADSSTSAVAQHQLTLPDGRSAAINDTVAVPTGFNGRAQISVVLVNYPEQIHYWVTAGATP